MLIITDVPFDNRFAVQGMVAEYSREESLRAFYAGCLRSVGNLLAPTCLAPEEPMRALLSALSTFTAKVSLVSFAASGIGSYDPVVWPLSSSRSPSCFCHK